MKSQSDLDLEKFIYENGGNPCCEIDFGTIDDNKITPSICTYGYHKWVWYVGLHMERYWFCSVCDEKDYKREAPKV